MDNGRTPAHISSPDSSNFELININTVFFRGRDVISIRICNIHRLGAFSDEILHLPVYEADHSPLAVESPCY